jgi:hypothetical protein
MEKIYGTLVQYCSGIYDFLGNEYLRKIMITNNRTYAIVLRKFSRPLTAIVPLKIVTTPEYHSKWVKQIKPGFCQYFKK